MRTNRIGRIVVGLALIGYGIYSGNAWFYLGVLPLITGVINWCPLEMKMGTCDPASGCCATLASDAQESTCCTPAKPSTFSAVKPAAPAACCSDDEACCSTVTKIEVLGTGCKRCTALEEAAREAVAGLDGEYEVVKVEDVQTIANYRVMHTPALVINGKLRSSGKVLTPEEIRALLGNESTITETAAAECCA